MAILYNRAYTRSMQATWQASGCARAQRPRGVNKHLRESTNFVRELSGHELVDAQRHEASA